MNTTPDTKVPIMVIFELPAQWPEGLLNVLPAQRMLVNKLLAEGTVQSYSLSADRTKVWMVLVVEDKQHGVDEVLASFPILDFTSYSWEPLLFTNDSSSIMHYSLN